MTDVISSILAINPDAQCQISDENIDSIIWAEGTTPIVKADILSKQKELQAEYDTQAYSRKREAEYPSIQECVHAILDDTLDALQAKRASIKTKYPKGG